MKLEVLPDAEAAARRAAARVAEEVRAAAAARGRAAIALSGGATGHALVRALAQEALPWERLHLFQVDERVAPAGDPRRNWAALVDALGARAAELAGRLYAMPVEVEDLEAAAARYAETLARVAGAPPRLDLVHLGLGSDGHTASLVPGDPVLEVRDADVAPTARAYAGTRRLTLTFPALARARRVLWLVTGAGKRGALAGLRAGDPALPAARVPQADAIVVADAAAAVGDVLQETK